MTTNERLYQFPSKPVPVAADIIFLGDSAAAFDEKNSTIAEIINVYPSLTSLGGITLSANKAFSTDNSGVAQLSATLPVAVQQAITQLGAQGVALNMNSHLINNVTDPVSAQDAATKNYVDTIAQGITVQGACRLATTGALTVTYSNGVAGIGATLTNAGAQAALTLDSVAAVVGDRILVKNQASALQNGIYTVTNIGSGSTNWIMTRATDYDQPAEINPGDLVVIDAGTTLASSSWLQTATVVTIGTDSISFSQFTASLPVGIAFGGTGAITAAAAQANLNSVYFTARLTTSPSNVTGDGTQYIPIFDTADKNVGGAYNASTGVFTAPVNGLYEFAGTIQLTSLGAGHTSGFIEFSSNASNYTDLFWLAPNWAAIRDSSNTCAVGGHGIIYLNATQTVNVNLQAAGSTKTVGINGTYGRFMGRLIG